MTHDTEWGCITMPSKLADLVLYGRYASPFVRRVAVSLRLYGIDYHHAPACRYAPIATRIRIATE